GERDSDDGDRPDREELAGLELEVGAGDVAGEVRPEVALLDDPVELRQGRARGEHVLDATLAGRRGGLVLAGCVAFEAGADRGAAAGRGDADRDQEDRGSGNPGDSKRQWIHGSASSQISTCSRRGPAADGCPSPRTS